MVIDAEDTDVVVLAAKVAHETPGDLGIKHKKKTMDCKKLCSSDRAIEVPLHCHSGCDFTSGFYGYGKITVMKQQQKAINSSGGETFNDF